MRKIGFTGHRNKRTGPAQLADLLREYPDAEWVHGGAEGFDEQVHKFAIRNGKLPQVVRPEYGKYAPRLAPLRRNEKIVDMIDLLVACYDGRKSGGTRYTIDYAIKQGKPVQYVDCQPIASPATLGADKPERGGYG